MTRRRPTRAPDRPSGQPPVRRDTGARTGTSCAGPHRRSADRPSAMGGGALPSCLRASPTGRLPPGGDFLSSQQAGSSGGQPTGDPEGPGGPWKLWVNLTTVGCDDWLEKTPACGGRRREWWAREEKKTGGPSPSETAQETRRRSRRREQGRGACPVRHHLPSRRPLRATTKARGRTRAPGGGETGRRARAGGRGRTARARGGETGGRAGGGGSGAGARAGDGAGPGLF